MTMHSDDLDLRLLNDFQRDLPLVPQPFAAMAAQLGIAEAEVIARLRQLSDAGRIARVGATCRPNTAGASTLAALQVPPPRIDEVAALVGNEPGVNHSYLREGDWNLWFVVTAPNARQLSACLARIGTANAEFARSFLQRERIPLIKEDLGGTQARRVDFRPDGRPAAERHPDAGRAGPARHYQREFVSGTEP